MWTKLTLATVLFAGRLAAVESRLVSVSGVRLHYVDWGGSGRVLIFVPGGCDTAFVFGDVAELLARQFRVLGLPPRGCGASDHPASRYGMGRQVEDLLGFLDFLRIERATLIGHSSGGGKITQFARAHPARVDRLVYLDTVYGYVAPGLEEKLDAEIAKVAGDSESVASRKRRAQLWEFGAWSTALDRNFEEIRRAETPPEWRRDIDRDMRAGLYSDSYFAFPSFR